MLSSTANQTPGGLRIDEAAVRLLLVEQSRDYADLLCETLHTTEKAHFEVRSADRFDTARCEVEEGSLDAVLVDLTPCEDTESRRIRIDEASRLATRVPVIVLTGDEASETTSDDDASRVREQIQASRLPDEILRAVHRHRRLGPTGKADPIVVRDPLRACARLFAKLRRSFAPA